MFGPKLLCEVEAIFVPYNLGVLMNSPKIFENKIAIIQTRLEYSQHCPLPNFR